MKKIPMRRCLSTNEMFPKKDLIRIVKTPAGEIKIDLTGRENGHGAYLSKSLESFENAKKRKLLNRAFDCVVPDSIFDELFKLL